MIKLIDLLTEKTNLTPATLNKDTRVKDLPNRGQVLLRMINDGKPLRLVTGEDIVIDIKKSNDFITGLINSDYKSLLKIPFYDKKGNSYLLGKLEKTSDFGGQDIARGMNIEDKVLSDFLKQIEEAGGKVNIKIGNTIYENITSGDKPKNNPKADFILSDDTGTPKIFISHKDYDRYQQYSGIAALTDYPEVAKFIAKVKKITGGDMQPKAAYKSNIQDKELRAKSVYGKDKNFGLNKVQMVCVGKMELVKIEDELYTIKAQIHWTYAKIPHDQYEPILAVSYRKGVNQQGLKNARFGIYPRQLFNYGKEI